MGSLPSSARRGFALATLLLACPLPNSNGRSAALGLSAGRFLAGSCLTEIGASTDFSRSGSFDSTAGADGEALEEDVSAFVLVEGGEESVAAYELFF